MSKRRPTNSRAERRRAARGRGQQSMSRGTIAALAVLGVGIVGLVAVIATSTGAASGSTDPTAFDLPAIGNSDTADPAR